jgi:hypothetical protein
MGRKLSYAWGKIPCSVHKGEKDPQRVFVPSFSADRARLFISIPAFVSVREVSLRITAQAMKMFPESCVTILNAVVSRAHTTTQAPYDEVPLWMKMDGDTRMVTTKSWTEEHLQEAIGAWWPRL